MTATAATIRALFPEFSDVIEYPDAQMDAWIGMSSTFLDPCLYTSAQALDYLTSLFVCHHLVQYKNNTLASGAGGVAGEVRGVTTGKTVDTVSKSMDVSNVTLTDGGYWNTTQYGIQFLQMARLWASFGTQLMPQGVYSVNSFNNYY